MRNRLLEIIAALVGVVAVVWLYADRAWFGPSEVPSETAVPVLEDTVDVIPGPREVAPVEPAPVAVVDPAPGVEQAVVDDAALTEAVLEWEAARESLKAVQTQLVQLDTVFDAREAEFAELEANGADSEMLEEEMLIFLDGIVEQYDQLETRLAEAEAAEQAAAERLGSLRGERPDAAALDGDR